MLDFLFLSHEDILEARVEEGYYHIYTGDNGFVVTACLNISDSHVTQNIGDFPDIYAALEAANKHYRNFKNAN